ncbi:MAG TPA: hypothetical protein VHC96_11675 [Puia sp.]|nr:hypothetical protein [Puia sp.]
MGAGAPGMGLPDGNLPGGEGAGNIVDFTHSHPGGIHYPSGLAPSGMNVNRGGDMEIVRIFVKYSPSARLLSLLIERKNIDMKLLILSLIFASTVVSNDVPISHLDGHVLGASQGFSRDTGTIEKKLRLYHASSCIEDLLKQVTKANRKYYDPKEYFYSLSFKKDGSKRYLVIETGRYKSSRAFDYVGVIKVNKSIFLCRGDIAADTLFKPDDDAFLNVYLSAKKDMDGFDYGTEPSLRGSYQECNGIKISLEIYTRAPLPGYKMKEVKSKKPSTGGQGSCRGQAMALSSFEASLQNQNISAAVFHIYPG